MKDIQQTKLTYSFRTTNLFFSQLDFLFIILQHNKGHLRKGRLEHNKTSFRFQSPYSVIRMFPLHANAKHAYSHQLTISFFIHGIPIL